MMLATAFGLFFGSIILAAGVGLVVIFALAALDEVDEGEYNPHGGNHD